MSIDEISTRNPVADPPAVSRPALRRVVISGALGNFIEWYDLAVYAYAAVGISTVLFPKEAGGLAVIETFVVFAITYLLRPVSGIVMGVIGDRLGRKQLLVLTIAMMAAATVCIGVIPTYATIGIGAPLLLLACRAVQGIAAGGEFIGASTYAYEHAPPHRRGLIVGCIQLGTAMCYPAAAFFSFALASWLGNEAFTTWGWRVLFLAAAPLGLIALYIRNKLAESPEFIALRETDGVSANPLKESLTLDPWRLGFAALFLCGYTVGAMTLLFYMPVYLVTVVQVTTKEASLLMGYTTLMFAVSIPLFGWIVDRTTRSAVRLASCVAYLLLVVPAFWLVGRPGGGTLVVGLLALALLQGFHYAVGPLIAIDVFPPRVRYTSGTIAYNIPVAVAAAVVPPVASYLVAQSGSPLAPAFFAATVTLLAIVGAVGLTARERTGNPAASHVATTSTATAES